MVRLFVGLLVLGSAVMAHAFDACTAYNPSDGIVCTMPADGVTTGVCAGNVCTRNYTIPGNAARTGTGTISSSGATVTGSGTAFTTELKVGDDLIAGGQQLAIVVITSNTLLTVSPAFAPDVSAGTAFTYVNPIVRWLDGNGGTIAVLDSRGFFAVGFPYAALPFAVQGSAETGAHVNAKQIFVRSGQGGPASSTLTGGLGGPLQLLAGTGGDSTSPGMAPGSGANALLSGGTGGVTFIPGDPDGAGGQAWITGGPGGSTGSGNGGAGGPALITGGNGFFAGAAGPVRIRVGAGTGAATTPIALCDSGNGVVTVGSTVTTNVDCVTGNITKIKNVPVAGMWNVNAFQQANAGGM